MNNFYKIVLVSILFLVSISGVVQLDSDNNIATDKDNTINIGNYIYHNKENNC